MTGLSSASRPQLGFFAAVAVLLFLAAGCSSAAPEEATTTTQPVDSDLGTTTTSLPDGLAFADGDALTLRVSLPSLDFVAPHLVDETNPVQILVTDLLTDGLTERDSQSGIPAPAIASSWSTSSDGLVWTFILGDATFSDATPVTASDVVASLNRVAAEGITSLSGPNLWPISGWEANDGEPVEGIVAVDETTVQIVLTERFEPLAEVLAGVAFGIWPAEERAVGALPLGSAIDFVPTALWGDGLRLEAGEAVGQASMIELFVDPTLTMLEAGETDLAVSADPEAPLNGLTGTTIQRSADVFFAMNSEIAPFDDVMIRQAIVKAVDREAIRAEYFPNTGLMQSFVPQQVLGGVADACGASCEFDVAQATLLVNASPHRDVPFTVDYFLAEDGDDSEQRLAESIASSLRDIGLVATARSHQPSDFGTRAARGELGLFRFGSVSTVLSAEADLGAMFHTAGRDNLTGTSIDRVDEFIASARKEANPVVRASIYENAERALFGEAVVLPLAEFRFNLVFGPNLLSAGLEPDGSLDLDAIEFAPVDAE